MKLEALLWAVAVRMWLLSRYHRLFRLRLKGKVLVIQITVAGCNVPRYFSFANGKLYSQAGIHCKPSLLLHFVDEKAAYHVIKAATKNSQWWLRAIQDKRLLIRGDLGHLTWFMELCTHLFVAVKPKASVA